MGEWYYLVQLRQQHKVEMLLWPKVFNPNSSKVQIYTMRINVLMLNTKETISLPVIDVYC
jgi:hypothetical protein